MDISSRIAISNAVKYPALIKDKYLTDFKVACKTNGQPIEWAGAFSVVYPMVSEKGKCALKIWFVNIDNNQKRYLHIKNYFEEVKLPYFINFEYINAGIIVNSIPLDTLRMDFVDGLNLTEYISAHLKDKDKLEKLASSFLKMFEDLHSVNISHGDLQPKNIKITNSGEIKLIDYDSLYIPTLSQDRDFFCGTPGYQLPSRLSSGFISSHKTDYFSELVIFITIRAVIENPLLWDKYSITLADDRLLFSPEDFLRWEHSNIRKDLNFHSDEIKSLVKIFDMYINSHIFLPSFMNIRTR